ncbi:MAG: helix-turn-helix transcriptional regulator [Lachnospiraceae bacterium]|nr:helix-turn-helix transcriptional regulator [Lachnospiraceae bacterium]
MPKILDQPAEKMLRAARKILLEEGYDQLTIRRIAGECGTAVGTVYNYFPSKDYLAAGVMLGDWRKLTTKMKEDLRGQQGIEGLKLLFQTVREFSSIYHLVWKQYQGGSIRQMQYHSKLLKEMEKYLVQIIPEEKTAQDPFLLQFLADAILHYGSDMETGFDQVEGILRRLI